MQMYLVEYTSTLQSTIEVGKVIVCAANNEQAVSMALMIAGVQPSLTTTEAVRVKPSAYQLFRKEFPNGVSNPASVVATEQAKQFTLSVRASLRAFSEGHAWRRFASAVIERASGNKPKDEKWLDDIVMDVETKDRVPRNPDIERQAIYTHHQIFSGGAARPR